MKTSLARLFAALALVLFAALLVTAPARADIAPQKDDPEDGGCMAGGLPWALPGIGLGIAFVVRHRTQQRDQDNE